MSAKKNKKSFAGVFLFFLAAAIVFYGAARTIESVSLAPSEASLNVIGFGGNVSEEDLQAIIDARTGNFFINDPARAASDFALAKVMLAAQTNDEAQQERFLGEAVTALEKSLSINPSNPYAWFRLAHVRNMLGAEGVEITGALRMSFMTGPHEPRLVFTRIPLALAYFDQFDETTESLFRHQIRYAWKKADRQTAYLASSFGKQDYFLEVIAAADPDGAERFQAYISFIENTRNQGE